MNIVYEAIRFSEEQIIEMIKEPKRVILTAEVVRCHVCIVSMPTLEAYSYLTRASLKSLKMRTVALIPHIMRLFQTLRGRSE